MEKILVPEKIKNSTRFSFDRTPPQTRLIDEFLEEGDILSNNLEFVKIIKKESTIEVIEINDDFISFYPALDDIEAENMRERIYKHIALRSEVYRQTSSDNMELAISSLLNNDLRSCASLLYYSLHKFSAGYLYKYLNKELRLDDYIIDKEFKEIDHFTSETFYLFTDNSAKFPDLTIENYVKVLSKKKRKDSVNAFTLLRYMINGAADINDDLIMPFIRHICTNVMGINFDSDECIPQCENTIAKFFEAKDQKKATQSMQVQAALSHAILQIKNGEPALFWMYSALSLRLYWLRQIADYEYDFVVRTSIRELSTLVFYVNQLFQLVEFTLSENENSSNSEQRTKSLGPANFLSLSQSFQKSEDNGDYQDIDNDEIFSLMYYTVSCDFPLEFEEDEVVSFVTGIFIDAEFEKDIFYRALNRMESISNRGEYFYFESKSDRFPIKLYLHLDPSGRWTFWLRNDEIYDLIMFNESDFYRLINEFFYKLVNSMRDILNYSYSPKIAASKPAYLRPIQETLDIQWVHKMSEIVQNRRYVLELEMYKAFVNKTNSKFSPIKIQFGSLDIYINLISLLYTNFDAIPLRRMFNGKLKQTPSDTAVINVIISESENNLENMERLQDIYLLLNAKFEFEKSLRANKFVFITPPQLKSFLEGSTSYIYQEVYSMLNEIAYDMIVDGEFGKSEPILTACFKSPVPDCLPYATMGLWYLRNSEIETVQAEELGDRYYKEAIEIADVTNYENHNSLKQKYHFEMANFYIKRMESSQKAISHIEDGIRIGEEGWFYEDLLKLISDNQLLAGFEQVAAATENKHTSNEGEGIEQDEVDVKMDETSENLAPNNSDLDADQ